MEDLQPFFEGSKAIIASIFATIALVISLLLCTCMKNRRDSRPKYMGCRPLTEEEIYGPIEKPAVIDIPPDIKEHEDLVPTNSLMANGHASDCVRNKCCTLNRQLPEIPRADSDPHNTYESTSELYATVDDTYSKVPRNRDPGQGRSQSPSLVEVYDPYSCVRDEVKLSKNYGEIKEIDDSPTEQDGGYTKVLAENKKANKKHINQLNKPQGNTTEASSLPYESLSDLAPPVPDKHFDVEADEKVSEINTEGESSQQGQPVSFNSIPMGMIDDTESVNDESQMQENSEDENSKELSYTRISVREPLASLKAKQFESYYSVVPEDDTYAQVDNAATSVTVVSNNTLTPVNLYAEIEISSNSSGYAQVERRSNSLPDSELPPAPPTVESLRSITIHSKEGIPEGPTHQRSFSAGIDIAQMYATVDKNKKTRRSFEGDPRASADQTGLDLNELKQMLDSGYSNSRTPPFPTDLYEGTGARPKSFKSDLSSISRLNGFRDDIVDSGYETVKDIKTSDSDETYDNLDKNYRLENSDSDPNYSSPIILDVTQKRISVDPGYETVLDAIVNNDLADPIRSSDSGQNRASFISESHYEIVEQKFNDPNYETIGTLESSPSQWMGTNDEQNNGGYESVESLNLSGNTEKRIESIYDTGYEGITIRTEVDCKTQVPNGPYSSVHSPSSTITSINQNIHNTVLPNNTQENSAHIINHTTDRKIAKEHYFQER